MKLNVLEYRDLRLLAALFLGLSLANAVWAAPSIQSIEVAPSPLTVGQSFTLAVTASDDVTQGTATVDFRPAAAVLQRVVLAKQGSVWVATGSVPANLQLLTGAIAKVTALMFDANRQLGQGSVNVSVSPTPPVISAVFSGGILTITGDDTDNTLIASRDATGNILVNGGAIAVTGGVPTVVNTTQIVIYGLGGNDILTVDDSHGPMPPAHLLGGDGDDTLTGSGADDILEGGPGNDILMGRGGNDTLLGGPGNDILIGGAGSDVISGGDGDDQIIWNPGDGSDVIDGDAGNDVLVFNGSNAGEKIELSANGPRMRFFRDVANITMDCGTIERVVFTAVGGADTVTVDDLTGTTLTNVFIDLSIPAGSGIGDSQADTVVVNGTQGADQITVNGNSNEVDVLGLSATVTIVGGEPSTDRLVINALGGDDVVDASGVLANSMALTLNGGDGNDRLIGGQGNDLINGGRGNDVMFGGAGDDTFVWNPGDGDDTIEGQEGQNTLLFNGANVNEKMELSANGERLRLFRDVANITMDCAGIQQVQLNAFGGADTITVDDLTGTDVTLVNVDLSATPGSGIGDGAADTVIVNGTSGDDTIGITGAGTQVNVVGLAATVSIFGSEGNNDRLMVNALDGDDTVDASSLQAGVINLTVDGGAGDDVLIGSDGADVLLGGAGDDVLIGGPGSDILDGGTGENILIQ